MKTISGRPPGSDAVLEVRYDSDTQSVDELIAPEPTDTFLSPGFIDLQVNGFAGVDFNDPDVSAEQIAGAMRRMAETGVSRCYPTVITGSFERMAGCLRNLARAKESCPGIAGFHIEGPYISPEDGPRGAHPREHVRPPDIGEFERLREAAGGNIRLITLSPEWDDAPHFIEHAVRTGAVVSVGHTGANSARIRSAVDAGATMSTHLGNGSHRLLHKTDNYIWDQLAEEKLMPSLIADGIHIPPSFFQTALRAKGVEKSVLVTDAVMPAMCAPGPYRLGQVAVTLHENGSVTLRDSDRLAGSALRMDHALGNAVRIGRVLLREAVTMATINAARAGRVASRQRGLVPGDKADFVRFRWDEKTSRVTVVQTVTGGETVFEREAN